jgi:hypothetical protein
MSPTKDQDSLRKIWQVTPVEREIISLVAA